MKAGQAAEGGKPNLPEEGLLGSLLSVGGVCLGLGFRVCKAHLEARLEASRIYSGPVGSCGGAGGSHWRI